MGIGKIFEQSFGLSHDKSGLTAQLLTLVIVLVLGMSARSIHRFVEERLTRTFFRKRLLGLAHIERVAREADAATDADDLMQLGVRTVKTRSPRWALLTICTAAMVTSSLPKQMRRLSARIPLQRRHTAALTPLARTFRGGRRFRRASPHALRSNDRARRPDRLFVLRTKTRSHRLPRRRNQSALAARAPHRNRNGAPSADIRAGAGHGLHTRSHQEAGLLLPADTMRHH